MYPIIAVRDAITVNFNLVCGSEPCGKKFEHPSPVTGAIERIVPDVQHLGRRFVMSSGWKCAGGSRSKGQITKSM